MHHSDHSYPLWQLIAVILIGGFFTYLKISNEALYDDRGLTRRLRKYLFLRNLKNIYKPIISKYSSFYISISPENKLLFERRVQKFIDLKKFIPRGGMKEITPEMKALIAGSAIQLTFGYPDAYFRHFSRILVYPDNYYSTITKKYHQGEVNVRGIIVLSWKSFQDGFMNSSDGRNLGLHEMAHALRLINIVENEEYDFYDRHIMHLFEKEAQNEITKLLNSPESMSFFRNYCTTNMDEFFSVAIECFFERSQEFKEYSPKIYTLLTKILKIDPVVICSNKEIQFIVH